MIFVLVLFRQLMMLDHRLQEVGSLVNHVKRESKQVLLSCGTSNDSVFTLVAAVVMFYV